MDDGWRVHGDQQQEAPVQAADEHEVTIANTGDISNIHPGKDSAGEIRQLKSRAAVTCVVANQDSK